MFDPPRYTFGDLLEDGRYREAAAVLQTELEADPHQAELRSLRALCLVELGELAEAESEARRARGRSPRAAFCHWALGVVLAAQGRFPEAGEAAERALALDPEDPAHHALAAQAALGRKDYAGAVAHADRGLQVEPGHEPSRVWRALALRFLHGDAAAESAWAEVLADSPANAVAEAGRAWARLARGDAAKARQGFEQALALDPSSAWAREGLVTAIKAQHPVYAWLLRYFMRMQRLSPGVRWLVIIGGVVLFGSVRRTAEANPTLAPVLYPLMAAYLLFVVLSWTADPLFDLVALRIPAVRPLLPPDRRRAAALVGGLLGIALLLAAVAVLRGGARAVSAAIVAGLLLIPTAAIYHCEAGWPRTAMAVYTAAVAALGLAAILSPGESGALFFALAILGAVVGSWLGAWLATVTPAPRRPS